METLPQRQGHLTHIRSFMAVVLIAAMLIAGATVVIIRTDNNAEKITTAEKKAVTAEKKAVKAEKKSDMAEKKTEKTAKKAEATSEKTAQIQRVQTRVIRELVRTEVLVRGRNGLRGKTGPAPTRAEILAAARAVCAASDRPCDGPAGAEATAEQVADAIHKYCGDRSCQGPKGEKGDQGEAGKDSEVPGRDGKDGGPGKDAPPLTDEQRAADLSAYCQARNECRGADGAPGPSGPSGQDGAPGAPGALPESYQQRCSLPDLEGWSTCEYRPVPPPPA